MNNGGRADVMKLDEETRTRLERMERRRERIRDFQLLMDELRYPEAAPPAVHVTGTNGKGSTSNLIASILIAGERSVGHDFASGMRALSGYPQPQWLWEETKRFLDPHLQPAFQRLGCSNENQVLLRDRALSLFTLCWRNIRPDVQVVEAGCGGGTDWSAVVRSIVSVITNVTMDHAEILGATVEEIAVEKAGILRPGVPAVTAAKDPAVLAVLRRRAAEVGTSLHILDRSRILEANTSLAGTHVRLMTDTWGELSLNSPLVGVHQIENIALAVQAVELLPPDLRPTAKAVVEGVSNARWPGRCQVLTLNGVNVIFDGAHNEDGARALSETIEAVQAPSPRVAVLSCLARKDGESIVRQVSRVVDRLVLTPLGRTLEEDGWDPAAAAVHAACPVEIEPIFRRGLNDALEAASPGGTVIVAGSLYTAEDGLRALTGLTFS